MKAHLNFIIAICFTNLCASAQTKMYKLYDKTINSDIDYRKLELLDYKNHKQFFKLKGSSEVLNKVFAPMKGMYTVYRFVSTYKGPSYPYGKIKTFHDLIIIKTDKSNKIIDGYQYTLEWGEAPFNYDLHKITVKNFKIYNNLNIEKLKFISVNESTPLNEPGTLLMNR